MEILVTGGAGFIGSNIVKRLEQEGHIVTVVDNFSTGNEENLKRSKAKVITTDISRNFSLEKPFDVYVHMASITDTTFSDDQEMMRQNIEGFKNILAMAKGKPVVYASSAAVYGNGPVPMREDQTPAPLNAYGRSKLEMDRIALQYMKKMPIIGLRFFNVFGPGEVYKGPSSSMIYQFWKKLQKHEKLRLFKWGEQVRDHIYVKDVVEAVMCAISAKHSGIYNVGTGVATSFNDVVKYLNLAYNTNENVEYFDNPIVKVYQANTQADVVWARDELHFSAAWALPQGILDYHQYLLRHEKSK